MNGELKFGANLATLATIDKVERTLKNLGYFRVPTTATCWVKALYSQDENVYGDTIINCYPMVVVLVSNVASIEIQLASSDAYKVGEEVRRILEGLEKR
jgi:hypothetical protein